MVRFVSSLPSLLHQYVNVYVYVYVYVYVSAHVFLFMTFHNGFMFCYILNIHKYLENMLSSIVKDATTFELEFCGRKQPRAQAHVRPHCVWLNFELTKKFESFKKCNFRDDKLRIRICYLIPKTPKSFELVSVWMVQNLKRRRLSCAEDWWFFHHQLMTDISMNDSPNQLIPILRSLWVQTNLAEMSNICFDVSSLAFAVDWQLFR